MNALDLSRLQFGLTIAFHYIFPPLSIGLGLILVIMEAMWLRTRREEYREMTRFWVKIFALIFSIGVASGIVMEFQFGTNWAAFEGHWQTAPADLYLLGWPHPPERGSPGHTRGVAIPGLLSFLVYGDATHPLRGLEEFGRDIPPVQVVFQTYHAMVSIGMALIALSLAGCYFWWRGSLWKKRWYLRLCVPAVLLPQAANQLGWISAEMGRQPWVVYGIFRTQDAISPGLQAPMVWSSVVMFGLIYSLLLGLFIYLLDGKIRHGPAAERGPEGLPLLGGDRAGG